MFFLATSYDPFKKYGGYNEALTTEVQGDTFGGFKN